jgi:hypothetical protein
MISTSKLFYSRSTSLRLAAVAAVLSLLFATPALRAEGPGTCSNATMHGIYAFSANGYFGGAPLAVAGEVIYDGQGNGKIVTETASVGGTIYRGITGAGNFTVNTDCTGSKSFTTTLVPLSFDFVISTDGSLITFIETDAGSVVTGTGVRIGHKND